MRLENILTRNTVFEVGDFQRFHVNCYARLSNDYAIYFRYNERFICHRNPKNPNEWIVIGKYEVDGKAKTNSPIDLDAIRRSGI